MLKAVGIICEYNPFHNGHLYQLKAARDKTQADVVVAIMSGNWLQRGEPAFYDKWQRTQMALAAGVDLVIELPIFSSVQPAHLFAKGAIKLAEAIGCTWLAFGAENPQLDYQTLILNQPPKETFKQFNQPYASIFQDYLKQKTGIELNQPNDILAFGYANANYELNNPLTLLPIKRKGSNHNDKTVSDNDDIASGTAIRKLITQKQLAQVVNYVPNATFEQLESGITVSWDLFWPYLRYELLETSVADLRRIYQMTEGIEYRLKKAALSATNFTDFLKLVKTKRYTYTRIQRLCSYVLFKVSPEQMLKEPNYLRILGFSTNGRHYLNQVKGQLELPLVTNVKDDVIDELLTVDYQVGLLFQMVTNLSQDLFRKPLMV